MSPGLIECVKKHGIRAATVWLEQEVFENNTTTYTSKDVLDILNSILESDL